MQLAKVQSATSEHKLKPGLYRLINMESRTAMDLSKGDGRSFIGWTKHDNDNQTFLLAPLGHGGGYSIQSVWNGHYATVEDGICTGVGLVGNAYPVAWVLEECKDLFGEGKGLHCYRIRWPHTRFVFDLEGYGCGNDGTRIQLAYEQAPVHPCQVWRFEEVHPSQNPSTAKVGGSAAPVSLPQIDSVYGTFRDAWVPEIGTRSGSRAFLRDVAEDDEDDEDEDDFQDASEQGLRDDATLGDSLQVIGPKSRRVIEDGDTTVTTTTTTTTVTSITRVKRGRNV